MQETDTNNELIAAAIQDIKQAARKDMGLRIKELREARGLTVRELGDKAGLGHTHIVRIEAGKYNVTLDTLTLIIHALGADISINLHEG